MQPLSYDLSSCIPCTLWFSFSVMWSYFTFYLIHEQSKRIKTRAGLISHHIASTRQPHNIGRLLIKNHTQIQLISAVQTCENVDTQLLYVFSESNEKLVIWAIQQPKQHQQQQQKKHSSVRNYGGALSCIQCTQFVHSPPNRQKDAMDRLLQPAAVVVQPVQSEVILFLVMELGYRLCLQIMATKKPLVPLLFMLRCEDQYCAICHCCPIMFPLTSCFIILCE